MKGFHSVPFQCRIGLPIAQQSVELAHATDPSELPVFG
jgi:hypothetical protein